MSGACVSTAALEHQRQRRARNKRVARALASGQRMSHEDALAIVAAVRADRLRKESGGSAEERVSFSDMAEHLAEAFAVNPSRREDAEHLARRAYLRRHASAQASYRDTGRHAQVCREWRARTPQAIRALCSRVWREVEEGSREDRRLEWHRREAVAWWLDVIRGGRA